MPVRKWVGDLMEQLPNMRLADSVSEDNRRCTECCHTLFTPCFGHSYCINRKSRSYGLHYHSWNVACKLYEEGERYAVFSCPFYDGRAECDSQMWGDSKCPYSAFD